ncbi:MAG: hypothetical protein RL519_580 [Pseudomonadota bacterium]|jgi:hypothetical protein
MSQQQRQETIWTKPQLVRLGKLADVAGAQTPLAQGNSAKT